MSDDQTKTIPGTIAFIGFGEAATAFVKGWTGNIPSRFVAYGTKTEEANIRDQKLLDYKNAGVNGYDSASGAASGANIIFSMVTADQALEAAQSVVEVPVESLVKGSLYFDCNSCAPDTKRRADALIEKAGGRYVDVALMAPVYPTLHKTPALVSGKWANDALEAMADLGMSATLAEGEIGTASSIKMIRSVMMKGLEALVAECVLSARKAGVEDIVLASLEQTYPGFDWENRSSYMLERMMVHGKRRAAEMREVALSIEQLGLNNSMSRATVGWQQKIGDMSIEPGQDDYQHRADIILAELEKLGPASE